MILVLIAKLIAASLAIIPLTGMSARIGIVFMLFYSIIFYEWSKKRLILILDKLTGGYLDVCEPRIRGFRLNQAGLKLKINNINKEYLNKKLLKEARI